MHTCIMYNCVYNKILLVPTKKTIIIHKTVDNRTIRKNMAH